MSVLSVVATALFKLFVLSLSLCQRLGDRVEAKSWIRRGEIVQIGIYVLSACLKQMVVGYQNMV